ncbi:MAG: cobalt-precorrin 5A hydrolase [Clostridia bacterium]|nr:cobalt-precorrin 5A hydrolase [Clostridia bacterium]
MKIGMICFTERGAGICRLLCRRFRDGGTECRGYMPRRFWKPEWGAEGILPQDEPLSEWTGSMFGQKRALVFIGAAGIAVRAIAPYVRDKMTDPPVVVADEARHFCIPLLSGHVGGANELAETVAGWLHGIPVITTATDVNGVFAVDVFATRNGLCITDRKEAKEISAWLLDGGKVGFFCDPECRGAGNTGDIWGHHICMDSVCRHNIWITFRDSERPSFLRLVPKMVVVGVGCRKGTPPDVLERRVLETLKDGGIDPAAVKALSTIDLKAGEAAVSQLAGRYGWELRTFTAGELLAVEGVFEESEFVRATVGVGNVCERSCTAGGGILLVHKRAGEGVTVAAAIEPAVIRPAAGTGPSRSQEPAPGEIRH